MFYIEHFNIEQKYVIKYSHLLYVACFIFVLTKQY